MKDSPFCRATFVIEGNTHDYITGIQHTFNNDTINDYKIPKEKNISHAISSENLDEKFQKEKEKNGKENVYDKRFTAVHPSRVLFLQNEAGYMKWTPSIEKIKEMQQIWKYKE